MSDNAIQLRQASDSLTSGDVVQQAALIQQVMKLVMKDGEHYGKIPGCGDKPTLLQPGAQKLALTFRLGFENDVQVVELSNGHREYRCRTTIIHLPSEMKMGRVEATCSTMESKYRFRKGGAGCPECGHDLRKSKQKDEWYCWQKTGGCGATFPLDQIKVEARVEHDNPADYYNTCMKMAQKRAEVKAVLNTTAATDIFTQDIEDLKANGVLDDHDDEPRKPVDNTPVQPRLDKRGFIELLTNRWHDQGAATELVAAIYAMHGFKPTLDDLRQRHEEITSGAFDDKKDEHILRSLIAQWSGIWRSKTITTTPERMAKLDEYTNAIWGEADVQERIEWVRTRIDEGADIEEVVSTLREAAEVF